jgi:hypothetical protein
MWCVWSVGSGSPACLRERGPIAVLVSVTLAVLVPACLADFDGPDEATCGDGIRAGEEVCDGTDFGDDSCAARGYHLGDLVCAPDCASVDASACSGQCGDGAVDAVEACELDDLGDETCLTLGWYDGTLACAAGCLTFDESGCAGRCGDGVLVDPEQCDGAELGTKTCGNYFFWGGTLGCLPDCTHDTSGCWARPRVVINEVVNQFLGRSVELLNLSEVLVELEGFVFYSHRLNPDGTVFEKALTLPMYALDPGARVLLTDTWDGVGGDPTILGEEIHWNEPFGMGFFPYLLELRMGDGTALDFVRFGGLPQDPSPGTAFSDTPAPLPTAGSPVFSYVRYPDGTDTDTAADWCFAVPTPGEPNVTMCEQFPGPGAILITEVAPSDGSVDRLELWNASGAEVDLAGWGLMTWDATDLSRAQTLPTYALPDGAWLLVVADIPESGGNPYVLDGKLHILDLGWAPGSRGAVVLLEPNAMLVVDYVRWGGSAALQMSLFDWADTPAMLAGPPAGFTLGRATLVDTGTAGDFCVMAPTLGEGNGACE